MSFNLVTQRWIPVSYTDNRTDTLSLAQTFEQADDIRDLGGETPLVSAALHRLLFAILRRAVPMETPAEWSEVWKNGWGTLPGAYLARWQGRFDIFDPDYPFWQCPTVTREPKSVTDIVLEWSSGNASTLFDHHDDAHATTIDAPEAARRLLVAQTFSLTKLSGIPGVSFSDAPWARGMIFLAQGKTLRETLLLNWLPADLTGLPVTDADAPIWEREEPWASDEWGDTYIREAFGYLDYLTWPARRLLLVPEYEAEGPVVRQIRWAPGYKPPAGYLDPHKHWTQLDKGAWVYQAFKVDALLWTNLYTWLSALPKPEEPEPDPEPKPKKRKAAKPERPQRQAQVFTWLEQLCDQGYLPYDTVMNCAVMGVVPHKQLAVASGYRREQLSLPLVYWQDMALRAQLLEALNLAETLARSIWGATRTWARLIIAPLSDVDPNAIQPAPGDVEKACEVWKLEAGYWATLSPAVERLLQDLPTEPESALRAWKKSLAAAVDTVLDALVDPDNLKASTKARLQLAAAMARELQIRNPLSARRSEDMENLEPFVAYLQQFHKKDDRAALADLRAGCGREPGTVVSMFPYVVKWTRANTPWRDGGLYTVAALFAYHPEPGGYGDFGSSLRQAKNGDDPGMENRLMRLLNADQEDLPALLYEFVTLLKARNVAVNWSQLLRDYWGWSHPDRYVQKRWAVSFWRGWESEEEEDTGNP